MRSRQGLGTNHTQPIHQQPNCAQRQSSKARKANTTSEEHDGVPNKGMPPDEIISQVRDPPLSRYLFTNTTPENLYGVRAKKGPQILGACGETVVMGGDTWTSQPPTTRRNRETLIGIEEAACGLKSSTDDRVTQALAAPAQVGEHIDALLRIRHSARRSRLTHPLGDGLRIYKEHQDLNTDVLETRDHPVDNNDPDITTLKTRPKPDVGQEPSQEDKLSETTKSAWHPTTSPVKPKPQPLHSRREIRRTQATPTGQRTI